MSKKSSNPSVDKILGQFIDKCLHREGNPGSKSFDTDFDNINSDELDKKINQAFNCIPTATDILAEALVQIVKESPKNLKDETKKDFGKSLMLVEHTAFDIYLKYEGEAFKSLAKIWVSDNEELINQLRDKYPDHKQFAEEICARFSPLIKRMEFRAGQKRKARGGVTFQMAVEFLLSAIGIPCEKPTGEYAKVLKRIDLVIPDQKTAIERPDQALFLSAKRTLRERWKQTIPERKPTWRVFLITVDEGLTVGKANEINSVGMIVYVKDELKSKSHLKNMTWVRRLSDLPKDIKV